MSYYELCNREGIPFAAGSASIGQRSLGRLQLWPQSRKEANLSRAGRQSCRKLIQAATLHLI